MRFLIFILIAYCYKVQSASLCDSGFCLCHNRSEKDEFGEKIDCSYFPSVLKSDYGLTETVYSLDLSWNNLTSVTRSHIFKSNTLRELFLNNNKISSINDSALQLPNLERLDLSNNLLEFIPKETFKYINKLEYLNLANNKFSTLSSLSFHHLGNLEEIILDNNNLGPSLKEKNLFDRNGYGLTHKIKYLSISGINLHTVYDNFFVDAYDIRKLVISNNNISVIFELPITLEYLDLSDNPLTDLSGEDFADVPGLKELRLNNLAIKEIAEYTFSSLHGLRKLQLERNKNLTKFSELAFGPEVLEDADDFVLEELSLKSSKLTTLSNKLSVPFGQLISLDLQGNMWNCDCHLRWIKKLQIQDDLSLHLRCYTPKPFFNSKIMDLNSKYFVCAINKHGYGAIIGAISACILLSFVALWVYVMVPKKQTRNNAIKNIYAPLTGYSLLPVHMNLNDGI